MALCWERCAQGSSLHRAWLCRALAEQRAAGRLYSLGLFSTLCAGGWWGYAILLSEQRTLRAARSRAAPAVCWASCCCQWVPAALTVLLLGCVLGECPAQHTLLVVWAAARCLHALIAQPDTLVLDAKGTQTWVFWGVKLLLPEQAGCGRKTCAPGGSPLVVTVSCPISSVGHLRCVGLEDEGG